MLFACEDNRWSATTVTATTTAGPGIAARAEALGIPATSCDGNDAAAVDDLAGDLVPRIRAGGGPLLLLARTYRWTGHTSADPGAYRDPREVAAAIADDPLDRTRAQLLELGVTPAALDAARAEAEAEMAAAVRVAEAAPLPAYAEAFSDVQDIGAPPREEAWA